MNEVDDFMERHWKQVELALRQRPAPLKHSRRCTNGQRQWVFSWHWPFVYTYISKAICVCEINQLFKKRCDCAGVCICDILAVLDKLADRCW